MRNTLLVVLILVIGIFIGQQDPERMKKILVKIAEAVIESGDEGDSEITEEDVEGGGEQVIFTRNAEAGMTIVVWDHLGFPIGNLCIVLKQVNEYDHVIQNMAWTNSENGAATLNLNQLSEQLATSLYIDPANHANRNSVELNSFEFNVGTANYGKKYCFQRSPGIVSNGQYEYYPVACSNSNNVLIATQTAPFGTDRAPTTNRESALEEFATPVPSQAPFMLSENFDYDRKEWNFEDEASGFDVFIDEGALILNKTIKQNFRLSRTTIPTDWGLENFSVSADIKSVVQPQSAEDTGRLSLLFREQEDGRYYILSIDQSGHSTIYFVRPGDDGLNDHELVESWDGTERGFDPTVDAINHIHITANGNQFTVQYNEGTVFEIADKHNFLYEAGGMSLALDGSEGNLISYRLDNLTIQEWPAD